MCLIYIYIYIYIYTLIYNTYIYIYIYIYIYKTGNGKLVEGCAKIVLNQIMYVVLGRFD